MKLLLNAEIYRPITVFSGNVEAKDRRVIYANQILQIKEFRVEVGELIEEDDDLYKTTYGSIAESPIDGEVLDIYVSENEQIMAGSKIMEIVDYSDLQISIKVDEYDLSAIKVGCRSYCNDTCLR